MEFHISKSIRERLELDDLLFSYSGNVVFASVAASRTLALKLNALNDSSVGAGVSKPLNAGSLFAMGLIDELSHALVARFRKERDPAVMSDALRWLSRSAPDGKSERLLLTFAETFPAIAVYRGQQSAAEWLNDSTEGTPNREIAFEEMLLLWLANRNPAFAPFRILFDDAGLKQQTAYADVTAALPTYFETRPPMADKLGTLLDALTAPMLAAPDSLTAQLDYIGEHWAEHLDKELRRVLLAIDVLREEELAIWMQFHPSGPDNHRHAAPGRGGEGFLGDEFIGFESEYSVGTDGVRRRRYAVDYQAPLNEYEAFSVDQAWMPTAVLIAKSTYVWLEQLSKKYLRHIHRLDQIPDEELQLLADRGVTGLWLIGLWERSRASKTIKRLRGNRDAVASAYSLKDYLIAEDLGGERAYEDLRHRASRAGLRLASDMVPNHMGLDSDWVIEHPDWFLWRGESPFPSYGFEGPDLSTDSRVEIKIEDHYYDQSDAAVVFRLRHYRDNRTRFMYHGNDGTMFAWNDTAQLDYSKAEVREHVIQVILNVARRFPIIRFDAAMVLAKRHVQRLWFPLPGAGGSIPSRAENAISDEQFNELMPHEFWREVVDRVAVEVPGTLLLAEAFWLLESYFVRTLGMHRVYNSAFMNMLRDEENAKYRSYLKKTVEFDPDILKRYVNFMSNPDERTAIDQFGSGDKYFGVSVLLATLPGLPMIGHGQVEGYTERYGMDFKVARLDEHPNNDLIARHQQLIAPLLKNRKLFAESTHFLMYDFWTGSGDVDENVFAYSNTCDGQRAVIVYNNRYGSTHGTIKTSVGHLEKHSGQLRQRSLSDGLHLPQDPWLILAYRDAVQGLEYLRRTSDLRDHGLTMELRGYQHVVLLDWRELQPTESHPWDRLCDALNGSGVYSVEDALTELRLQPVVESLHCVIRQANIHAFARAAGEFIMRTRRTAETTRRATAVAAATEDTNQSDAVGKTDAVVAKTVASAEGAAAAAARVASSTPVAAGDESLQEFLLNVRAFTNVALHTVQLDAHAMESCPWKNQRGATKTVDAAAMLGAAVKLQHLTMQFPEALQAAARTVLPTQDLHLSAAQGWAPVLAWITLRTLPTQSAALAVYDGLRLRHALAETFSAVGLSGEPAWMAAAQVRALLVMSGYESCSVAVRSVAFWNDADVRWLTGIHDTGNYETDHHDAMVKVERFDRARFEAFVCWLKLPALLAAAESASVPIKAANEITAVAANLAYTAKVAAYDVRRFLEVLNTAKVAAQQRDDEAVVAEHADSLRE